MKHALIFLICTLFSLPLFSQQSEIQALRNNLINDALVNKSYRMRVLRYADPDYSKAKEYLKSLNKEGGWSDIDYNDRDNDWHPLQHLNRLVVMTDNYMQKTSTLYQNKMLLKGIEKAITYWYTVNPVCDNWYKNLIAKQYYFNIIALLLEGKIDPLLHKNMVDDLTEKPFKTGSNRTLAATSTLYKGVLENNPEKIKLGVTGVTDQILVTMEEGIQPDYSFHQHGKFLYNGNYGFNYLRESVWLATVLQGTKFAFSEKYIKVLRDYYLEGTRWMVRGGLIDYNVRGRQVGRADALRLFGSMLVPVLRQMCIADPEYAQEYNTSIEKIEKHLPQNILGHKHYWRSDYSVHHHEKYTTSLKMCSERTVGIELNMNSENKLGYWLPYGLTYIYRNGREYDSIFPVWDWARLPGVTNPYIEIEEKEIGVRHTQQTSFVGGVSNGKYGVSTMGFSKNLTKAKKSWFWFDDEWVALGAGIESEHDSEIITSINQSLRKGEVIVHTEEGNDASLVKDRRTLSHPKWILHDSVGYLFPSKVNVEYSGGIQSGNMQRIHGIGKDTVYSKEVFSVWIDHGEKPKNESYEYIVVPGISKSDLEEYTKKQPVKIILNNKQIQAVSHKMLQLIGIVFHKKGEFKYENLAVEVNAPCILLIDKKNNSFSVSEPTQKRENIEVSITKNNQVVYHDVIKLPKEGFKGKSVSGKLKALK